MTLIPASNGVMGGSVVGHQEDKTQLTAAQPEQKRFFGGGAFLWAAGTRTDSKLWLVGPRQPLNQGATDHKKN